jgi:hypothetical protein
MERVAIRSVPTAISPPDGRLINGTDAESTTGYTVTSTWHRGHQPGRYLPIESG